MLLCVSCIMNAQLAPPASFPMFGGFDPNMSEEQVFNELVGQINSLLPPEEQEKFWQDVAAETERLEQETANMSPEDKEKYLLNLISEAEQPFAQPAPAPEPPAQVSKPTEQTIPVQTPTAPLEKAEDIIKLIATIIKSIESFITKTNSFPDFDGKVKSWLQKGRLTDWQAESWSAFKHELNKFVAVLARFKEKDPKIGLKHITELSKNEGLLQQLKQLQRKLADYETSIKITPFEIANMSDQTKNACIHVINSLTNVLYGNKIIVDLLKVAELFDPTAKKLREEEEKSAKMALTAKRTEQFVPVHVAGKAPARKDAFELPSFDDLGFGPGRPSYERSYKGAQTEMPESKKEQKGTQGGGGSGKGGTSEQPESKDKTKGTPGKGPELAPTKPQDKSKEAPQIKHAEAKKNIEDLLRKDLEAANDLLLDTPELQSTEGLKQLMLPVVPAAATAV